MEKIIKIKNKKVIYFADLMLTGNDKTLEDEFTSVIAKKLRLNGLEFTNVHYRDIPPFGKENYDILFFDWGGMSIGNSLMETFCVYIIEEAQEKPNNYYIMASSMTAYAMKDALREFGDSAQLHNIFLDIYNFIEFYKKYELKI